MSKHVVVGCQGKVRGLRVKLPIGVINHYARDISLGDNILCGGWTQIELCFYLSIKPSLDPTSRRSLIKKRCQFSETIGAFKFLKRAFWGSFFLCFQCIGSV